MEENYKDKLNKLHLRLTTTYKIFSRIYNKNCKIALTNKQAYQKILEADAIYKHEVKNIRAECLSIMKKIRQEKDTNSYESTLEKLNKLANI